MTVKAKIFGKDKNTIINKVTKGNPSEFTFKFSSLPCRGDYVLIKDGDAQGKYVVDHFIHEIFKDKSYTIMVLIWHDFLTGDIDN